MHQNQLSPAENKFHAGNGDDGGRMSTTGWIVVGVVLCVVFNLAFQKGAMRIEKETSLKRLEVELALKKEENKRMEIMKEAISEARKAR